MTCRLSMYARAFYASVRETCPPPPCSSLALSSSLPTSSSSLSPKLLAPLSPFFLPPSPPLPTHSETATEFRIEVDLPGHKKDDIDISVDEDVLTVQSERREETSEDQPNYHVKERRVGKSKRTIRLPKSADTDSVRAQYLDGVLRICVDKKTEKPQSKNIKITDHSYPFAK